MADTIPSAQPPARRNMLDVLEDMANGIAALVEAGGGGGGEGGGSTAITVTPLLAAATAVAAGASTAGKARTKTYQAWGTTSGGAGAASVDIEGSNDGTRWDRVATLSLVLGTAAVSESFTSDDRYAFVRANLKSISGTGAAVTVNLGA